MHPETTQQEVVHLRRRLAAPPERVYRAWLDPELLRRWFAPSGSQARRVEVDERVGGRHQTWQAGPDGDRGGFDCELTELVPSQRIVFLWRFVGPDRTVERSPDSVLTVTFAPAPDGGTVLDLRHERLDGVRAELPSIADHIEVGWTQALDQLVELLGAAS